MFTCKEWNEEKMKWIIIKKIYKKLKYVRNRVNENEGDENYIENDEGGVSPKYVVRILV